MLYSSDDTHIKNRNDTRATPRQVRVILGQRYENKSKFILHFVRFALSL